MAYYVDEKAQKSRGTMYVYSPLAKPTIEDTCIIDINNNVNGVLTINDENW